MEDAYRCSLGCSHDNYNDEYSECCYYCKEKSNCDSVCKSLKDNLDDKKIPDNCKYLI